MILNAHSWWSELSTFGKVITGVAAAIGGVKAGWTPLSTSAKWLIEKYDKPVYAVLEGRKRIEWLTANPAPITRLQASLAAEPMAEFP